MATHLAPQHVAPSILSHAGRGEQRAGTGRAMALGGMVCAGASGGDKTSAKRTVMSHGTGICNTRWPGVQWQMDGRRAQFSQHAAADMDADHWRARSAANTDVRPPPASQRVWVQAQPVGAVAEEPPAVNGDVVRECAAGTRARCLAGTRGVRGRRWERRVPCEMLRCACGWRVGRRERTCAPGLARQAQAPSRAWRCRPRLRTRSRPTRRIG